MGRKAHRQKKTRDDLNNKDKAEQRTIVSMYRDVGGSRKID
jgi:hypothetical protein